MLLDDDIDERLGGAATLVTHQKVQIMMVMILYVRKNGNLGGGRMIACFHLFGFGAMRDYLFTQLTVESTDFIVAVFIDLLLL